MGSVLKKWGRNIPFLSPYPTLSQPQSRNLFPLFYAINADCSVVAYTSNPNFEFMPPDGILAQVSKINTTTFEKSNEFLLKQGLIHLVPLLWPKIQVLWKLRDETTLGPHNDNNINKAKLFFKTAILGLGYLKTNISDEISK